MAEREPHFESDQDKALYLMAASGWANQSLGSVNASSGYFARITITDEELFEVAEAFEEQLREITVDPATLVGRWLIQDRVDFPWVKVEKYDDEIALKRRYNQLRELFKQWTFDQEGC